MVALKRHNEGSGFSLGLKSVAVSLLVLFLPNALAALERLLDISTPAHVSENGKVEITLNIKNNGAQALFNIRPIFHFHHSMYKMPGVSRIEAGEVIRQKTSEHPDVLRVGRYPLMAVVNYQTSRDENTVYSQTHADSFYYREPVVSVIDGEIASRKKSGAHLLKILLKNNSPSLKNIRVMLLLPPELVAQGFKGMMGFTMRPGEQKYFEVPVRKLTGKPGGKYPVHLMVEYAEMLKHYSSVIPGEIHFSLNWSEGAKWAQLLAFIFLFCAIIWFLKNKSRGPVRRA